MPAPAQPAKGPVDVRLDRAFQVVQRLSARVEQCHQACHAAGEILISTATKLEASQVQAAAIAEKIRLALDKPYSLQIGHRQLLSDRVTHHCSASIGVTLFLDHEDTEEEVLNRADSAMYAAMTAKS